MNFDLSNFVAMLTLEFPTVLETTEMFQQPARKVLKKIREQNLLMLKHIDKLPVGFAINIST